MFGDPSQGTNRTLVEERPALRQPWVVLAPVTEIGVTEVPEEVEALVADENVILLSNRPEPRASQ
jgi:hypothetical protein